MPTRSVASGVGRVPSAWRAPCIKCRHLPPLHSSAYAAIPPHDVQPSPIFTHVPAKLSLRSPAEVTDWVPGLLVARAPTTRMRTAMDGRTMSSGNTQFLSGARLPPIAGDTQATNSSPLVRPNQPPSRLLLPTATVVIRSPVI